MWVAICQICSILSLLGSLITTFFEGTVANKPPEVQKLSFVEVRSVSGNHSWRFWPIRVVTLGQGTLGYCCSDQALSIMREPLGIRAAWGGETRMENPGQVCHSPRHCHPDVPFSCFHKYFLDFSFGDELLFNSKLPFKFTEI